MSRVKNWIDRPEQYKQGDLDIMYSDYLVSADQYRTSETGTNPGFSDEVDNQIFLRTINVRIDMGKTTEFVGLTDNQDVAVNDILVWTDTQGNLVNCLVKKSNPRESGTELELDYV